MSPLAKKLQLHKAKNALIVHAPEEYVQSLGELPEVKISSAPGKGAAYNFVHYFVLNSAELQQFALSAMEACEKGAILWISFPKKSGKIRSDINRDSGWDIFKTKGYDGVSSVSIDDDWSAIRLKEVSEIKNMTRGSNPKSDAELEIPADLKELLQANPGAKKTLESFAFTYRKEYVMWITGAKREETRAKRLATTIEKLNAGKKLN